MSNYYINEANSTVDYIIVEDDNGNTYEYQANKEKVFICNRYIGDEGEEINDTIADEIRAFCESIYSE